MVGHVVWGGMFGLAVRAFQLGIEKRPLIGRRGAWVYPAYAAGFGLFGYWLEGVESRQIAALDARKRELLEKRARRAEREKEAQ